VLECVTLEEIDNPYETNKTSEGKILFTTCFFVQGNDVLLFDGQRVTGLYDYKHDVMMQHNLVGKSPRQSEMERKLKAIIQSYMSNMINDRMVVQK